jgi:hypothetical protein
VTGTFPSRGFIQQQLYVKNLSIEIVNKYNGLAVLCSGWSVIKTLCTPKCFGQKYPSIV